MSLQDHASDLRVKDGSERLDESALRARTWGLLFAVVASVGLVGGLTAAALRERERELRAQERLVLSVLAPTGLLLLLGGIALRNQRKELDLKRELAVAAARANGEGTGLGLAIANEIVKSHLGTISLARRIPRGTSAVAEIPADQGGAIA